MAEIEIDIGLQRPKPVEVFREQDFDRVITLCDSAAAQCPFWLGRGRQAHIGFPDPATAQGTEEDRLAFFRQVRDAIREKVLEYLRRDYTEPAEEPLLRL